MSAKGPDDLCSYRRDWLLAFLLDRLRLGWFGVALVALVFFSGVNILLNWLSGTLFTEGDVKGLWSAEWATHWTAIPVLLYPSF